MNPKPVIDLHGCDHLVRIPIAETCLRLPDNCAYLATNVFIPSKESTNYRIVKQEVILIFANAEGEKLVRVDFNHITPSTGQPQRTIRAYVDIVDLLGAIKSGNTADALNEVFTHFFACDFVVRIKKFDKNKVEVRIESLLWDDCAGTQLVDDTYFEPVLLSDEVSDEGPPLI